MLDDLGLGPNGPPIPPPITFSMVPFPKNRVQSNSQLTCDCFAFLGCSGLDEQGDEKKDSEEDVRASSVKVMILSYHKLMFTGTLGLIWKTKLVVIMVTGVVKLNYHNGFKIRNQNDVCLFLCICVCLCTLKEEAVATSKSRMKGNTKEAAKDKDKKGRESQKGKRRTSAKTKTKGSDRSRSPPLHVYSMSGGTEQDQHQANLELKRNQRQGNT